MKSHRTLLAAVLFAISGALFPGCSMLGYRIRSPITRESKESRFGPGKLTAAAVQSELMSFTDTFDSAVAEQWNRVAADGRAESDPDDESLPEADREQASRLRRSAIENKLATVSAALSIASSPNPTVALADMITMITLQRMVLESPASLERYGDETTSALLTMHRDQEEKIWRIAARAMSTGQQQELRDLIAEWRAQNPDAMYVANVRLEDFAKARQQSIVEDKKSGDSLLSLIALDPLAGLDPAQREVQKSRMLGERVFFYGSRLPQVLKWQVESLSQELLRTPELAQVSGSIESITESISRVTAVAERLPEDLDAAQEKFQDTLGEFRETADATDRAASTLATTIRAADAFTARFRANPDAPAHPDEPKRNVLAEYQAAVAQTGDAADRLTTLAQSLDALLASPALGETAGTLQAAALDVQSGTKDVIDYAFVRLIVLALVIPFAIALAAALNRRAIRRHGALPAPSSAIV